ncbi:hypothetical protein VTJ49DRAFT_4717 [Mycothermus thermophilus]|uniref:DUF676 domain-containing protein n=1 Tax=Humicola insolens TaxID=85995 RepID=A0ABR3V4Q2_HUMIN
MNTTVTQYGPHNQGLFILNPSDPTWERQHGPANLDVVAVHGLNGERIRSWTRKDPETNEETLWLRDMLPQEMPRVRAMTFGYNASVVGNTSVNGIRDNARSLLEALRLLRDNDGSKGRPIVFLGHSLGGIIIKQALCTANIEQRKFGDILTSTRGIVFFGTPHRGTDAAVWGEMVARIKFAAFGKRELNDWFRVLRPDQKDLVNVSEDFRPLATRFAISSFYEENAYPNLKKVIVEKKSAILEMTHEDYCAMPGHHSSIVKFSKKAEDQQRFTLAWRAIERVAKGPDRSTTAEFRAVYREVPETTSGRYAEPRWEPVEVAGRIEAPNGFGKAQLGYSWKGAQNTWDKAQEREKVTTRGRRWEEGEGERRRDW